MARVKLSAIFTSISGRFGGGVFRNWKGLKVLSVLQDYVYNPSTNKQTAVRELLAYVTKQWHTLTQAEKSQWNQVAVYLTDMWDGQDNPSWGPKVCRSPRGPFTPIGAFMGAHSLAHSIGEWDSGDALIPAPVGKTASSQPIITSVTGDTDGVIIAFDDPNTWGAGAHGGFVRVWCMYTNGAFFSQFAGFVAGGVGTITITQLVPRGGRDFVEMEVGELAIQLDAVNDQAIRSAPSDLEFFQVAEPIPP